MSDTPIARERAAFARGEIDLDEYERRIERLLDGRPAQPPSVGDRALVQALARRLETR